MNGISLCVCILCVCKHAQPLALRIKRRKILQVIALNNFFFLVLFFFFFQKNVLKGFSNKCWHVFPQGTRALFFFVSSSFLYGWESVTFKIIYSIFDRTLSVIVTLWYWVSLYAGRECAGKCTSHFIGANFQVFPLSYCVNDMSSCPQPVATSSSL